jgi:hypothetical protein
MATGWFPTARKDQHELIATTTAFMSDPTNRTRVGFDTSTPNGIWYDSTYSPKLIIYNSKYTLWINPATNTQMVRGDLNDAEKVFFPLYREFHGLVKASPIVTNSDLIGMGFDPRPDGNRTSHPVDKMFVDLNVKPIGNCMLEVSFENRDTGSSSVPYFLTGVVVFHEISDTPITDPNKLTKSVLASRSPHILRFSPEKRGLHVYMAGCYQNRRGEKGPWSEIVTVVVP